MIKKTYSFHHFQGKRMKVHNQERKSHFHQSRLVVVVVVEFVLGFLQIPEFHRSLWHLRCLFEHQPLEQQQLFTTRVRKKKLC